MHLHDEREPPVGEEALPDAVDAVEVALLQQDVVLPLE